MTDVEPLIDSFVWCTNHKQGIPTVVFLALKWPHKATADC